MSNKRKRAATQTRSTTNKNTMEEPLSSDGPPVKACIRCGQFTIASRTICEHCGWDQDELPNKPDQKSLANRVLSFQFPQNSLPWALIVFSLLVHVGIGISDSGAAGAVIAGIFSLIRALIASGLGIMACLLMAMLFNTHFGTLRSAVVKLAAVTTFPYAVGTILLPASPALAGIVAIVLWVLLLKSLFQLELMEVIVFVVVLFIVVAALESLTA